MGLVLLVPGLILDIAGSDWFSGASTVGVILIIVGGILLLMQVLMVVGVLAATTKSTKRW